MASCKISELQMENISASRTSETKKRSFDIRLGQMQRLLEETTQDIVR